jgi:hypothetical protein
MTGRTNEARRQFLEALFPGRMRERTSEIDPIYKELTSFANYPYRDRMMEPPREADWEFMQTLLLKGFRELASEMGLTRKRPDHIG